MSVSGTTGPVGTPAFEPTDDAPDAAPAAETVAPERPAGADAMLDKLNSIAGSKRPWLPSWLGWLDGSRNVRAGVAKAMKDDKVTADEVRGLVEKAFDFSQMSSAEKGELKSLLKTHAARIEPAARQALADFLGVENPLPGGDWLTGPLPTDFVPKAALERYGLSTDKMETTSAYDGPKWDVGYFPYTGDGQYQAFAKHAQVFGHGAEDAHAYFEHYSNPPSGLARGSWIASGRISEGDFEGTAGVDITGDRPVDAALYKAIRESGADNYADFAVLDAEGKQLPFGEGDRLVPTEMRDGKPVEVGLGEGSSVTWMIRRADGKLDEAGVAKGRSEVLGLQRSTSFDFLDATGRMVSFRPQSDRMVECFEDGGRWHALAKLDDGRFEHQVIEGGSVKSTETIDEAARDALIGDKETMIRVQTRSSGELKGDGKVAGTYNMGWWGKCHNVASIGTSNMERPAQPVRVVNNLEAGEALALRYGDNVLRKGGEGYVHEVRGPDGQVQSTRPLSAQEAADLAKESGAEAVIVRADGSLKAAEVTTFDTEDVDALVSHIGDGAVVGKGGEGCRYYGRPDTITLKDGTQIDAHIKSVETRRGKTETIGSRSGTDFDERDRSPLRAPGMESRILSDWSGRRYAMNEIDMARLNRHRSDDIEALTVVHPDGREETIDASKVEGIAWENRFDFSPDKLWNLHKTVNEDGSTVSETYAGTQVWNYTTRGVDTTVLDPKDLSDRDRELAKQPGMMAGTVGEDGKSYFRTVLKTDGGTKELTYWVRFDDDGDIEDYAYLDDDVPDFVWTQHVKSAYDTTWSGESQAPGITNAEIQRLYLASLGALGDAGLPGGFIGRADLEGAPVVRPEPAATPE